MKTKKRTSRLMLLLPMVALMLAACPKSPEERVAKLRSYYTARLLGFIVDAVPEVAESSGGQAEEQMAEADVSEAEVEDGAGEGVSMETEIEIVPTRQNVRIDILIQHDSPEKLPGITLDIEMVDSQQGPKNSWKLWVDTSELPKATGSQFVHLLEDVDYVEGDGFNVEVRSPVPPEERTEYREFSAN